MRPIKDVAVVATAPFRKLVIAMVVIVVAGACLAIGFALGIRVGQIGDPVLSSAEANAPPRPIKPLAIGPAPSVATTVEAGANERLRRTLKILRDRIGTLEEELGFYRRLIDPLARAPGFRIEQFTIVPTETPGHYSYNLLLMQIANRHESIAGTLQVEVGGEQGGTAQTLPLQDLTAAGEEPQTFEFLYFQDFQGRMTLPPDFVPHRVAVTAQIADSREAPLERVFDWRVEEE